MAKAVEHAPQRVVIGSATLGGDVEPMIARETQILASNVSSTGPQPAVELFGGNYMIEVRGTFGGTSIQTEYLGADDVTWVPSGPPFVAEGEKRFEAGAATQVRLNPTGGAPSGIYAKIKRIPA